MLTFLLCLFAGDPLPAPRWHAETGAHSHARLTLHTLDAKGKLVVQSDGERRELADLIELRRDGAVLPPILTRNFVCLNNGDRIPLDAKSSALLDKSRLHVWPTKALPSLAENGVSLYVPNVEFVFWSVPDGVDEPERFFAGLETETRKRDVVYLQNGDRLEGTITALTGKEGCFATIGGRKVQTPWSKLAGLAWSTDRQSRLKTKSAYWRAVLDGGARINLTEALFDEKSRRWTVQTQFGPKLELPESAMIALERRQGSAAPLADLTPAKYEARPYLGVNWELTKSTATNGQPLRLGENTYEAGIGLHAPCRVEYKLDGKYQRFFATVGMDAGSRRGRAKVAFELDGKRIELNEGKELTNQTAPLPVHVDLTGVRTFAIITELGSFGDVQAHVNLANARLVKR